MKSNQNYQTSQNPTSYRFHYTVTCLNTKTQSYTVCNNKLKYHNTRQGLHSQEIAGIIKSMFILSLGPLDVSTNNSSDIVGVQ
jgi:hypothetical protein